VETSALPTLKHETARRTENATHRRATHLTGPTRLLSDRIPGHKLAPKEIVEDRIDFAWRKLGRYRAQAVEARISEAAPVLTVDRIRWAFEGCGKTIIGM
jgi:hypothetical protein